MRTATLLLRALLLIPLVALIGLPAAANAAGPLATARASSTGHFITTAPLGPSFSLGALAWPSTSSAALKSVISRDGTVAFISQSANGGQVASYARDPDTGALGAQLSVQLTQANQGGQMALTPDGTQLFVATFDGADAWLDHFTVQPNGSLTPTGSTRTWTLDQISDIVVSPDGASVYMALSSTPSNIHQFDLAGSTLSAKTPMQVSTGGTSRVACCSPTTPRDCTRSTLTQTVRTPSPMRWTPPRDASPPSAACRPPRTGGHSRAAR